MTDILIQAGLAKTFKNVGRVMSGYKHIDDLTGGFRRANTYCVGGIEKSGKSSLLMKMVGPMMDSGNKILYINTELSDIEFLTRMAAINTGVEISKVEVDSQAKPANETLMVQWAAEHKEQLIHYGIESKELLEDNQLSFPKTMTIIEREVTAGCSVVILDNATTYKTVTRGKQEQWERLSEVLSQLINYTKAKNIVTLCVIHTKGGTVFKETPQGIRHLLKSGQPERIFDESVSVVSRPSLDDAYGGKAILSQLSGALLVWRPFQKVKEERFQRMAAIVLESFRFSPNGEVKMLFHGSGLSFDEFQTMDEQWESSIIEEADEK